MFPKRVRLSAIVLLAFAGLTALAPAPALPGADDKQPPLDYSRDILPILSNNCFICHGPAEKKAGLRLDLRDQTTKKTRSGAVPIVPGNASASELVRRIFAENEKQRMPPERSKKSLTQAEKETLKNWIDQGGEYKLHWSFVKPARPPIPSVKDKAWVKNEIDAFILERLEKAGLKPSPPADRTTLIRRLSLDLRGLPPSLEEVDEFLADKSGDAYEKLVDHMLASPRYGEKMALLWLDLARFGDTSGFHFDSTRQMWLWRDWVVNAFNKNMPFDQFTIEQLAGDLLPTPTIEQKIASGFNRNSRFNEEGGVDPEEYRIRYGVDRTNTLGQVWLGLTLGCAECHSHKYDPISQKEYYQLFAYFAALKDPMKSGNHNEPLPPLLKVPSAEQIAKLEKYKKELARTEKLIAKELARIEYKDPLDSEPSLKPLTEPADVVWIEDDAPPGAQLQGDGPTPWKWVTTPEHPVFWGDRSTVRTATGLSQHYFTGASLTLTVHKGDQLFAHVWLDPKNPPKAIMLQFNDGSWEHRAYWGADLCFQAGSPNGPSHFRVGELPENGKWIRLQVGHDKVGLAPGAKLNGWAFTQHGGTVYYDHAGIHTKFPPDPRVLTSLKLWQDRERTNDKLPKEVQAILKAEPDKRTKQQTAALRDHFLRFVFADSREIFDPLNKEHDELQKKIKQTEDAIPYTLISEEMAKPPDSFVLLRGDFQTKGEKVERALPSVFPPMPEGATNDRLGLAKWLVRPDHPLTARVAANRFWAQFFGTGLVKTIGDFGSQGEFPSHPELLDWLAVEFLAGKWDVKAIVRKIVLSSTYQQTSVIEPGSAQKIDPSNRLLSRMPRFRLSAEEIRDSALAISGLLSSKIGGPSVMPYQPPDFYKGKMEGWPWAVSQGEDQYRRGLYTFWRRTTLHPMFAIFDAPSREECSAARPRTNTPLQALVTLNDPTFVEAARVFAQRILASGLEDVEGRLTFAYRCALARPPSKAELDILKETLNKARDRFSKDSEAALKLVNVGSYPRLANLEVVDLAVWTSVANVVLNLDEVVTRE